MEGDTWTGWSGVQRQREKRRKVPRHSALQRGVSSVAARVTHSAALSYFGAITSSSFYLISSSDCPFLVFFLPNFISFGACVFVVSSCIGIYSALWVSLISFL